LTALLASSAVKCTTVKHVRKIAREIDPFSVFGEGIEADAALSLAARKRRNGKFGQNNATGLLPSRLGLVT